MFDEMSAGLDVLMAGVGDVDRQREFRMCITLCRHRALTQGEFDALPVWWHEAPPYDIAGGPVEVRWHRGVPESPSTKPCANPHRERVGSPVERLWLPMDCGACESCLARASCHV